jgi:hypothetical protein
MAGNFAVYQQSPTYKDYNKQSQMPLQVKWGPKSLEGWLVFWQTTPNNSFDVGYMISWGARSAPFYRQPRATRAQLVAGVLAPIDCMVAHNHLVRSAIGY